jgi:hypothetical protein
MYDSDLIDNSNTSSIAEFIAANAIGLQNEYINCNRYMTLKMKNESNFKYNIDNLTTKSYVNKNSQSKFLYELEQQELDKELSELEFAIKSDLESEQTNYVSRLKYSLENNSAEVDLCYDNITWTNKLWDGEKSFISFIEKYSNNKQDFGLYDIYIKIEKTNGEFSKKDLLKFKDFKINFEIGGCKIIEKYFFNICFFELIQNEQIIIEPNILYLKAFTFENMKYGIPVKFLGCHNVSIVSCGLKKDSHSNYNIDVIFSGKNLFGLNIDVDKYCLQQLIIQNQIEYPINKINSGDKIKLYFSHPTSIILFFLYDRIEDNINDSLDDILDDFELDNLSIDSVGIGLEGIGLDENYIWWDDQELIKIDFMGIKLCAACIDPQLRYYNKFCSFANMDFDPKTIKSINFSRIDCTKIIINYDSDKKYNLFINALNINILSMMSGMAVIAYAS